MARARNRRTNGAQIKTAAWAAQYQAARLPDQRGGAYLTAADLDELRNVIESLRDAQLGAWNAQRRGDPEALKRGLEELVDAVHEAISQLKPVGAIHPPR